MTNRAKLLWRCRRGVREMDILFTGFMEQHYDGLSDDHKQLFEGFLDEADPDIMNWIMGRSEPENRDYRIFIEAFQQLNIRS